ncbi:MAG: hypothetical protein ISR45_11395 [Rhodospirillales bacterium]|nr:hypothetical protein [Rhodospirillales bacterium]
MSTHPLSNTTTDFSNDCIADVQVSLIVSLTATPSARLTHNISAVLNRNFERPYTFLGTVGEKLSLDLHLSDPGVVATEILVKRLLKIKGVKRLKAERVCSRRGTIYAIKMKPYA